MTLSRCLPVALLLGTSAAACGPADLPDPSSPAYQEAATAFHRGVAAAQAGESNLANAAFGRVAELAPGEPAAMANLGLIALQRREPEQAAARLAEARALAPGNGTVLLLSALVEREQGQDDSAAARLREAIAAESGNLRALYLAARVAEERGGPGDLAEARDLIERLVTAAPGNLAGLLERARLAARQGDSVGLAETLERVSAGAERLAVPLPAELEAVRRAAADGAFDRAATELAFLQTALQPEPAFRDDQNAVLISPSRGELLLTEFVRLPAPVPQSAPAETALTFEPETLTVTGAPVAWVRALWFSEDVPLALVAPGADTLWISPEPGRVDGLPLPGGGSATAPAPSAVVAFDYDYDFLPDLAVAGPGGLLLWRQNRDGTLADVSSAALPAPARRGAYAGAWAADLDLEGDLDLVLAAVAGPAVVLRNLGDGTFDTYAGFPAVPEVRDLVWGDLDADGDPDAVLLDASGTLHVFLNERAAVPRFRPVPSPEAIGPSQAIAAGDLNQDATLDLVVLGAGGVLHRLALGEDGAWDTEELASWPDYTPGSVERNILLVADLDNNGDLDLLASGPVASRAWLHAADGFVALAAIDAPVTGVADLSGDGRLDLLAALPDGTTRLLANGGTLDYYSTTLRPRAAQVTGDRRINSFGIGGEIEVRAGPLYQKQLIEGPTMHFGLGTSPQVDVARIIWPNGSVQAEFNLAAANEAILTRQRLKGSCPWVFTYDGQGMQFVTDFIWRSALGLRINAQGDAAVIHDEDWIRIRGDQLVPRDGYYDVRITAELWETHFFDHVSLLVVDHPRGTEMFVDERFTLPAPTPGVHIMEALRPIVSAVDDTGRDVTALLATRDGRYVDTFALGPYQGIAAEHHVEIVLGDNVPAQGPLWLVASGWVYPTDASINVAASQGRHAAPRGVRLDVPDGRGGWRTAVADLGFPAGKTKTVLIDLADVFLPGTEQRLRLSTNMEIYWDRIAWAVGLPDARVATRRLLPDTAELRYRGFSEVSPLARNAPEIPDYGSLRTALPQWRDLVGYHTRFGDVAPLTAAVDDRYLIMNAGDELVLRFPAPPPPDAGWTRDFVLIGDGWVKDGDYNTGFSTTVRPLPYHGLRDYARAPGRLTDDPGYTRHPDDWKTYHTRYVTPREFHRALVSHRVP